MPWEDVAFPGMCWGTVLYDEQNSRFVMWYHAWWRGIAVAYSKDGLHWERPTLGVFDLDKELLDDNGKVDPEKAALLEFSAREEWESVVWPSKYRGKQNNLIKMIGHDWTSNRCCSTFAVAVYETREEKIGDVRYVASYNCGPRGERSGMCIAWSRDGVTFKALSDGCIAGNHCNNLPPPADTLNQMLVEQGSISTTSTPSIKVIDCSNNQDFLLSV